MPLRLFQKPAALVALSLFFCPQRSPAQEAETKLERIPIADLKREKPVDFEKEILPLFRENCLACHNATDAKGDLILETPEKVRKGGENGPAVVPGKSTESLLLKLASHQEKPVMPPRKNKAGAQPLTPEQLGLIGLWIDQGATGTVSSALGPIAWQGLPEAVKSIDAVALSQNGQFAACNRGNQIFLYRLSAKELMQLLADPDLATDPARGPIADHDLIQSLAFSPDGNLLAAGCYRSVKFWKLSPLAPRSIIQHAAAGAIQSITAAPNGKSFATGGADGLIRTWDANSSTPQFELSGHTASVTGLAFSHDGKMIASVSRDKTLRLWNAQTGEEITKKEFPAEVLSVAWGEKSLAAGFGDNVIRLFEVKDGKEFAGVKELSGHAGPVTALAFSATRLVSGSKDKSVRIWNLEDGQQLHHLDHGDEITSVALRPDGKRVASAGNNHAVKLWNPEDGKLLATIKGDPSAQEFASEKEREVQFAKQEVDFFKDTLKKAEEREKTETEALKKATEAKEKAEKSFVEKSEAFKKSGEAKAAAEKEKADLLAAIESAQKQKPELEKQKEESAVAAKSGTAKAAEVEGAFEKVSNAKAVLFQQIIDAGFRAKLAALDLDELKKSGSTGQVAQAEKTLTERRQIAEAFLDHVAGAKSDFDKLLTAKNEAVKLRVDAETKAKSNSDALAAAVKLLGESEQKKKQAEEKITSTGKQLTEAEAALKLTEGVKSGAMQAFDSTTAAVKRAGEDIQHAKESVSKAETVVAQTIRTLEQARGAASDFEKAIPALAFSPDNRLLLFGSEDGAVRSVTADDGRWLDTYPTQGGKITSLCFVSAERFAAASSDQSVRLWSTGREWNFSGRIGTGDESSPFADRVLAVKFSPDGQFLATGGGFPSRSGEIKIWRTADLSLVRAFPDPHSDTVLSLDWSRDGKLLASGGADKFARVFDVSSGKQLRAFEGHTHHVLAVSWKPDGRLLASGGADKFIKIWDFVAGEQRKSIDTFNKEVTSLSFVAATGELFATSADKQIKLLREDGNQIRTFEGANQFISAGATTPDGKIALAGSLEGTLRAWNLPDGKALVSFEPPSASIISALNSH